MKLLLILLGLSVISCNGLTHPPNSWYPVSDPGRTSPEDTLHYNTYCNSRCGYCIDYPGDVFYPQPESTNDDGRIFNNKNGDEVLRVWGMLNMTPDGGENTLNDQFNLDLKEINDKKGIVTYKKEGANFYVISGYLYDKIFYWKLIVLGYDFAEARLQYDEADSVLYNKIAERIFKSFKGH